MFALSTIYWIASVVLIFRHMDYIDNGIKTCYGRDINDLCINHELSTERRPPAALLAMMDSIFYVNVST